VSTALTARRHLVPIGQAAVVWILVFLIGLTGGAVLHQWAISDPTPAKTDSPIEPASKRWPIPHLVTRMLRRRRLPLRRPWRPTKPLPRASGSRRRQSRAICPWRGTCPQERATYDARTLPAFHHDHYDHRHHHDNVAAADDHNDHRLRTQPLSGSARRRRVGVIADWAVRRSRVLGSLVAGRLPLEGDASLSEFSSTSDSSELVYGPVSNADSP